MSPALAGGFFTTEPPEKPLYFFFFLIFTYLSASGFKCCTQDLCCGMWDLVPFPVRSNLGPLHWKFGVLDTGLPGKFLFYNILLHYVILVIYVYVYHQEEMVGQIERL